MRERNPGVLLDGFEPIDWQDFKNDLRAAEEWLESLGIRIASGSRLQTYRRHVEELAKAEERGSAAITAYARRQGVGIDAISNAVLEATEWRTVYRVFQGSDSPKLRNNLKAFARGPAYARAERPGKGRSTAARDYGFELFIAARLRAAGFEAEVGGSGSGDVWLGLKGQQIFVECKRPQDPGQIKNAVKKAHSKLKRRYYSTGLASRGFVALSATKILNPRGCRFGAATWPELQEDLKERANRFIHMHSGRWTGLDDARTLGALVEFRCMAWIEEGSYLATAGSVSLHYTGPLGTDDHRLSLGLLERYPHRGGIYRRRLSST